PSAGPTQRFFPAPRPSGPRASIRRSIWTRHWTRPGPPEEPSTSRVGANPILAFDPQEIRRQVPCGGWHLERAADPLGESGYRSRLRCSHGQPETGSQVSQRLTDGPWFVAKLRFRFQNDESGFRRPLGRLGELRSVRWMDQRTVEVEHLGDRLGEFVDGQILTPGEV